MVSGCLSRPATFSSSRLTKGFACPFFVLAFPLCAAFPTINFFSQNSLSCLSVITTCFLFSIDVRLTVTWTCVKGGLGNESSRHLLLCSAKRDLQLHPSTRWTLPPSALASRQSRQAQPPRKAHLRPSSARSPHCRRRLRAGRPRSEEVSAHRCAPKRPTTSTWISWSADSSTEQERMICTFPSLLSSSWSKLLT